MREADFFADCGSPENFNGRETVTGDTLKHISIILLQKLLQLTSGVQGNAVCKAADVVGTVITGEIQVFSDGFISASGIIIRNKTNGLSENVKDSPTAFRPHHPCVLPSSGKSDSRNFG